MSLESNLGVRLGSYPVRYTNPQSNWWSEMGKIRVRRIQQGHGALEGSWPLEDWQ
jgi:hypothetical protein